MNSVSELAYIVFKNTVLPLSTILALEHVVLKYAYQRQTALERLVLRFSASGKTDVAMAATTWIPIGLLHLFVRAMTLPGLVLLALMVAGRYLEWDGVLGPFLPNNYAASLLLWYLAFDFSHYLSHYLLHRVPLLWHFHRLHHGALEFNIITGTRVSFAERAFNSLVSLVIVTMAFGIPKPEIYFAIYAIHRVVNLLQHSDIPWDYGIVGCVIASPRFHRMHHSNDPRDYDSNYGDLFTIWDRLFGTISKRFREEGSQVADEIQLGLGSDRLNEKHNNWLLAIYHHTLVHYAICVLTHIVNRRRNPP